MDNIVLMMSVPADGFIEGPDRSTTTAPDREEPAMAAYVIVETDITDPEGYERYKAASPGAVAAGGGRFLVRGGDMDVLEGDWRPPRLVVLEFEDLAAARRWYDSEIYRQARALREGTARLRMVAVQGVDAPPGT